MHILENTYPSKGWQLCVNNYSSWEFFKNHGSYKEANDNDEF